MAESADEEKTGVSSLELFFDLVFVFTITQLTSVLSHELDLVGLADGERHRAGEGVGGDGDVRIEVADPLGRGRVGGRPAAVGYRDGGVKASREV